MRDATPVDAAAVKTTRDADRVRDVLASLTDIADQLIASHEQRRELWWPSALVPSDDDGLATLRTRARELSPALRVALAVNLLTEKGLPHFHRVVAQCLGESPAWRKWNHLWTAEEDRHGAVLRDYCRASRLFPMQSIEQRQFEYLRQGFSQPFDTSPYHMLIYATVQERATQVAYGRIAAAARDEPTLHTLTQRIAGEEARHYAFYRQIVAGIIEADPEAGIEAAVTVLGDFDMPGKSIPDFRDMADVVRRAGFYGPDDFITIVEEQIRFWRIAELRLSGTAEQKQAHLLDLPRRLSRIARFFNERLGPKTFSFDFLNHTSFTA